TSIFAPVMAAKGKGAPAVTLTEIDTAAHRREIVIGDMSPGWVRRFSPELQCFDSIRVYGAPVAWRDRGDSGLFCNIGEINPNNGMYGSLSAFSYGPGKRAKPDAVPFLRGLARPVDIVAADLNQDGKTDYLVCEFGNLRGALSWTENLGKGQFVRHVLREQPGAIKACQGCKRRRVAGYLGSVRAGRRGYFSLSQSGPRAIQGSPAIAVPAGLRVLLFRAGRSERRRPPGYRLYLRGQRRFFPRPEALSRNICLPE